VSQAKSSTTKSATVQPTPRPLKPRLSLFFVLFALFLGWVGLLLAMYFKTVYPARHPQHPTTQIS
jgi:hypothetical protein